jgi:hypothetical protein
MITEIETKEIFKTFPNDVLVTLYGIAMFHEKYIFAKWVNETLNERGFVPGQLQMFSDQFTDFYNDLLSQNDL